MKKEKWQIIDDIEEIQDRVNGMGLKGSNEIELWTRDLIADYIVNTLNIDGVVLPNDSEGTFYCLNTHLKDPLKLCEKQCEFCKVYD